MNAGCPLCGWKPSLVARFLGWAPTLRMAHAVNHLEKAGADIGVDGLDRLEAWTGRVVTEDP